MKLQIQTSIVPMTRLGKIASFFARDGKALESHLGAFSIDFKLLEGEPRDLSVYYELHTIALRPRKSFFDKWMNLQLPDEKTYTWTLTFPIAGMSEFRIYLANLLDEDILIGNFGEEQVYKTGQQEGSPRVNTRYYLYNVRIYSYYDLLLFFFALISGIGAVFEILNFIFK